MAERYVRQSAGVWRDTQTGKLIRSANKPIAPKTSTSSKTKTTDTKKTASGSYSTENKTAEQLQKDKDEFTRRAEAAGGLDKSPNYAARVEAIDSALKTQTPATTGTAADGATTTETPPPAEPPPVSEDIQRKIDYYLKAGGDYGKTIGDKYFSDGALGRIDASVSPEMQDVLNKQKLLAETAGQRSPEQQAMLEQMLSDYTASKNFTPLEQEAIANSRAALSGLTPQQQEALMSMARENINRDAATRAAQARTAVARSNMSGAAGASLQDQIQRDRTQNMRLTTRDLMAKQIDEQRLARESFNSLTGQFEAARSGRTDRAANTYQGALRGAEDSEMGQKLAAQSLYGGSQQWADAFKQSGQQFNIGQQNKEVAGRVGAELGGVSAITGMGNAFNAEALAEQNRQDVLAQMEKDRAWQEKMIAQQNRMYQDYLKRFGRSTGV